MNARETLTERAKRMYELMTDNHPTIHCNRFPSWSELSRRERQEWLDKAEDAEHLGRQNADT